MHRYLLCVSLLAAVFGCSEEPTTSTPSGTEPTSSDPTTPTSDPTTPTGDPTDPTTPSGPTPPSLSWVSVDPGEVSPRWGQQVSGDLVAGGLNGILRGTTELSRISHNALGMQSETVGELSVERYCGCAFVDETRSEAVFVGGRNSGFNEEATAEVVDLLTGTSSSLPDGGAASAPVGCSAWFSADTDAGYVFGGSARGDLSATTWRYDPDTATFVDLQIAGPPERYDAGVVSLDDGTVLVVGGYVDTAMAADVWRFDPASEAWTHLAADGAEPPGRRFPFAAVHDDWLLYGYGSPSLMGDDVLDDLWAFHLDEQVWVELSVDGPAPSARAFGATLPGGADVALYAFGSDGDMEQQLDAWRLVVDD